uniref:Uncharacterized protein n=1 Tax=Haptolina ericina TaxID=156174 RepID=A0A7S3ATA2_9EUKA|mmetsp:Transcript_33355/g.75428  ORF Transcript_33355/g.75428 Transcript_33355/m.75428 type:complete len:338 (+) Transcript_33355:477-1490(+)
MTSAPICGSLRFTPFALVHSAQVQFSRLQPAKAGKDDCLRCISFNHKAGTMLSRCFANTAEAHGVKLQMMDHANGACHAHARHVLQVNMVRSPFVMVDSGYNYHRALTPSLHGRSESWAFIKIPDMSTSTRPLFADSAAAYNAWKEWNCSHLYPRLVTPTSYTGALRRLGEAGALLFESVRALYRNIPSMIHTARLCAEAAASGLNHSCSNVWMDAVVTNLSEGFRRQLAPSLGLMGSRCVPLESSFVAGCDPALQSADSAARSHMTDHSARDARIALLRQLDKSYLDSRLLNAETELLQLSQHTHHGHTHSSHMSLSADVLHCDRSAPCRVRVQEL